MKKIPIILFVLLMCGSTAMATDNGTIAMYGVYVDNSTLSAFNTGNYSHIEYFEVPVSADITFNVLDLTITEKEILTMSREEIINLAAMVSIIDRGLFSKEITLHFGKQLLPRFFKNVEVE